MQARSRQQRLARQRHRQRLMMMGLGGLLFSSVLVWNIAAGYGPKNQDIKTPEQFYRPEIVDRFDKVNHPSLATLPLRQEDTSLKAIIEQRLAAYPTNLVPHLFYYNLQDQSYVSVRGTDAVAAASVIKLPILMAFFRDVDAGNLTPYQHLLYQDFEQAAGSGSLQFKATGQPLPAIEVARQMIQTSDNSCTNMLIYHLGGVDALNSQFKELGLQRTHLGNWLPDLGGTNVISMQDMAMVLYNIDQSEMLTEESKTRALDILTGTHNRGLIPALLPKGTQVAHKTGDIGTSLGNSGLITLPNGAKYILAIQVERPFNNYGAKDLIQQISKDIYDNVSSRAAVAESHPTTQS